MTSANIPQPPSWLAGVPNPRWVEGNIWEIDTGGAGAHYVGP